MRYLKKAIAFLVITVFATFSFVNYSISAGAFQLKNESNLYIKTEGETKYIVGISAKKKVFELIKNFDDHSNIKAYKKLSKIMQYVT